MKSDVIKLLIKFREMIKSGKDFTFVKLGDGELICMLGNGDINGGKNIDGSHYTPELGAALIKAYNSFVKQGAYIANKFEEPAVEANEEFYKLMLRDYEIYLLPHIPGLKQAKRVPGNLLLHQKENLTKELHGFYEAIRNSKRKKVFIGTKRLHIVSELLKTEFIEIPEVDAFNGYLNINWKDKKDKIVMASAGMAGKVFLSQYSTGTMIDFGSAFDPIVSNTRTNQVSQQEMKEFYKDWLPKEKEQSATIPKKIFTAWLGGKIPAQIKKCIDSQKISGYEHHLITLNNCPKNIPYVNAAIKAKKWVKAVDFLKMYYLEKYGGIFLDADVQVLSGRNYDELLTYPMFAAREENGFVGYSLVGSVPHHPLAKKYLEEVPKRFIGDDNLNFESSMEVFTHLAYSSEFADKIKILEPEYFFPYNHQIGIINVTDKTISFHHFWKSWKNEKDLLPTVSILLPHIKGTRKEGLKNCLQSIDRLYYPKHLIETIIIEGGETVPQKIKKGLKKSKGDIIVYAADDMTFEPYSLYKAIKQNEKYGLVSFNEGKLLPDNGNICTHFTIRRNFLPQIKNEIFDTRFHHCACDNILWKRAEKLNEALWCEDAVIQHNHFSKGNKMDDTYKKGWSQVKEDRKMMDKIINEEQL